MPPPIRVAVDPPYTAFVERGGLRRAGALVRECAPRASMAVVLTSPRIRGHWGAALEASLQAADLRYRMLELADGEEHKRLSELDRLAESMAQAGADRDTVLVALGGGVVGDVGGLLASVYMRGIRLVQIPTTLLAMVDSALGGKTGVNLEAGKNLVGTFYHPQAILADPAVLATLAEREYRSGLAEAVKYGIIGSAELFAIIERNTEALRAQQPEPLETLIAACLEQKAAVVAADERESDRRRMLNFGHTLGHALESATGYTRYLHGEAVAWGMLATTRMAVRLGRLAEPEGARMQAAILRLCSPLPPLLQDTELVLRHAATDKKARGGQLYFALPTAIGRVEVVPVTDRALIAAALEDARGATPARGK